MSGAHDAPAATATVAVRVAAAPAVAFDLFTREIDRWWLRGPKYRHAGRAAGSIRIEPNLGGRVVETWRDGDEQREFELGRVTAWQPPERLAFTWRNATFAPLEQTAVDVHFAAAGDGTLVTVRHSGWLSLRRDHPARHGMADAEFARSVGMWWSQQLTALREHAAN
ncbi:MAG TPA: SRPBCC domain-containing protein [Planctomycetota bacterium]|nr:SRPBCC domain-containing protein [Planctomycetota bacterium]